MFPPEFIDLFNLLYPLHFMLFIMSWSSTHAATAPDTRVLRSIWVLFGDGQQYYGSKNVENQPIPAHEYYKIKKEHNVQNTLATFIYRINYGKTFLFSIKSCERFFYIPDDNEMQVYTCN